VELTSALPFSGDTDAFRLKVSAPKTGVTLLEFCVGGLGPWGGRA